MTCLTRKLMKRFLKMKINTYIIMNILYTHVHYLANIGDSIELQKDCR